MNSGVYAIITPSGRRYIGSAVSFAHRWAVHRWQLRNGCHHSPGLQAAANKYGEDALRFEILERVAPDALLVREQAHIDAYGLARLLNCTPVAGSQLGFRHSETTRANYSASRKGKSIAGWTPERRARMQSVLASRGPASPETRAKMSVAKKGRKLPEQEVLARSARLANRQPVISESGYPGVTRWRNKWQARLHVGLRQRVHVGYFHDPAVAYAAICAKAQQLQVTLPVLESAKP